jgi:hypothetical protein
LSIVVRQSRNSAEAIVLLTLRPQHKLCVEGKQATFAEYVNIFSTSTHPALCGPAPSPGLEPELSEPKSDVLPITPRRIDVPSVRSWSRPLTGVPRGF